MTNSKNSNLEDVSKGNDESAPGANDSASNKKTRFTKSKSISEVFKELEFEDGLSDDELSNDLDDSSVDEIIPIHNEYGDLENSDALDDESIEGAVIINPDLDSIESADYEAVANENMDSIDEDSLEISDSIDNETDSQEFTDSIDSVEDIDDEVFIAGKDSDGALTEEMEEKIGKSSAQGVLINDKNKTSDLDESLDIFNSSTIISIVGFIVGFVILLIGITYYASSSDRVVDNVLSGETAGLAIFLVIIGLIIIGFSLLKFFSSSKSSLIIDTFNSIKSIDYDEVSEDVISRDDFDAVFGIFKRKKDSDFSDNDKSVDSTKDLFESNKNEISDEEIDSLYSKSNLTSQKNQSSSKKHEHAKSTEISQDNDDGVDEIIPIHSRLNEQSGDGSDDSLEDKYAKYDFEDDFDDDLVLDEVDYEEIIKNGLDEEDLPNDIDLTQENSQEAFDEDIVADSPVEEIVFDTQDALEESEGTKFNQAEENIEEGSDSSLEVEKMDGLEDKYAKYDFGDDSNDEAEESIDSKPKFKKSVDLSKFDKAPFTEEELSEEKRISQEKFEEKKRRIIEGTNFDNSLRKQ